MEANGKKFNLFDFAIKHQKALIITSLILGAVYVVYALIFATPFYGLVYYADDNLFKVNGAEIYHAIQPFNHMMLNLSLVLFVLVIAIFVYFGHKRRIYYISNYITIGAFSLYSSFLAIYNLINIIGFRVDYNKVDFVALEKKSQTLTGINYTRSTFTIDFGIVLSVFTLLFAAMLIILAVAKYKARKKELTLKAQKATEQNISGEVSANA